MNTKELANKWGLSVEETVAKMKKAGVYTTGYDVSIDEMGMRRLKEYYPELFASKPVQPQLQKSKDPDKLLQTYAEQFQCIFTSSSLLAPFGVEFLEKLCQKCTNSGSRFRPVITKNTMLELVELARSQDTVAVKRAHAVLERLKSVYSSNSILWFDYLAVSERIAIRDIVCNIPANIDVLVLTQQPDYFSDFKEAGLHIGKDEKTGRKLYVMRIGADGTLQKLNDKKIPFRFPEAATVTTLSTVPIPISQIPQLGDTVYTSSGETYQLAQACGTPGTEGAVYKVDEKYAAKIFKQGVMNPQHLEKLKRMTAESDKFNRNGICWPCELLFNSKNEPVGYLMALAVPPPGKKLYELASVMVLSSIREKFPEWSRKELIQLCITILEKIVYLHRANVILGDINDRNFLIADENTVFFVDCDSYQISELPCPVGVEEYVAPEIHREKGRFDVLRTMGNENFAVATLLFRLLMLGKRPYDLTDGEGVITDIINADFAYPLGPDTNKRTPVGPYRYVWSQMPYFLKKQFYYTFKSPERCEEAAKKSGGESDYKPSMSRYAPDKRPSSAEWLKTMNYYLKKIDNMPDDQANILRPDRFKIVTKTCKQCGNEVRAAFLDQNGICKDCRENSVHCKLCGQYKKAPAKYKDHQICQDCLDIEETYKCATPGCGEYLTINNFQKYIRGKTKKDFKYCKTCQEERRKVYTTRTCTSCGKPFEITYGEKSNLDAKGHELPKRCKECRKQGLHGTPTAPASSNNYQSSQQRPNTRITFTTGYESGSSSNKNSSKSFLDILKDLFQ